MWGGDILYLCLLDVCLLLTPVSMLKRVAMLPESGDLLGFLDEEPKAE